MGMTRIGIRVTVVALVATVALSAFFLRDTPPGITFAQGTFNLTIDSSAWYNDAAVPSATWALKDLVPGVDTFFNFDDIKPGDFGKNVISLHVSDGDAWMCMDFTNLESEDNSVNEPEQLADNSAGGELADELEFFAWRDDGDNVFEVGEHPIFGISTQSASILFASTTHAIADSTTSGPCEEGDTCYVGIQWCAGELSVNFATAVISCDGSMLGNASQTDTMSVDVSLRSASGRDLPSFTCSGAPPPPDDGDGDTTGFGEEIGLYIKCEILANMGWPLPDYSTECPDGFPERDDATSTSRGRETRTTR